MNEWMNFSRSFDGREKSLTALSTISFPLFQHRGVFRMVRNDDTRRGSRKYVNGYVRWVLDTIQSEPDGVEVHAEFAILSHRWNKRCGWNIPEECYEGWCSENDRSYEVDKTIDVHIGNIIKLADDSSWNVTGLFSIWRIISEGITTIRAQSC